MKKPGVFLILIPLVFFSACSGIMRKRLIEENEINMKKYKIASYSIELASQCTNQDCRDSLEKMSEEFGTKLKNTKRFESVYDRNKERIVSEVYITVKIISRNSNTMNVDLYDLRTKAGMATGNLYLAPKEPAFNPFGIFTKVDVQTVKCDVEVIIRDGYTGRVILHQEQEAAGPPEVYQDAAQKYGDVITNTKIREQISNCFNDTINYLQNH